MGINELVASEETNPDYEILSSENNDYELALYSIALNMPFSILEERIDRIHKKIHLTNASQKLKDSYFNKTLDTYNKLKHLPENERALEALTHIHQSLSRYESTHTLNLNNPIKGTVEPNYFNNSKTKN